MRTLLRLHPLPEEVAETLGNGIEAQLSVPTALYAFTAHYDSFAQAVLYAVRLGGDTDTIGAMTGAIAGAFHGASAIPPNWLDALENGPQGRDYVTALADNLYDRWRQRTTGIESE
jgi:poly(ADP-ribose) glycohydrolase ARH3